ncbi:MAG: hypothetical protein V1748_11650 [Actinomycetota bacterium]
MKGRRFTSLVCLVAIAALTLLLATAPGIAGGAGGYGVAPSVVSSPVQAVGDPGLAARQADNPPGPSDQDVVSYEERQLAAARAVALGLQPGQNNYNIGPGDVPDYFGMANYANSPLPRVLTTEPSPVWYFAEGTCRPNFIPYITIENPGLNNAAVAITYMKGDGTTATQTLMVPKNSRSTVIPTDVLGVGDDPAHDFSAKVQCTNGQKILAERPMYFNYKGAWTGGHDAVGETTPGTTYYFAEGTTRPDFDPWICIQNPGTTNANVTITYYKGDGTTASETLTVAKNSRRTVDPRLKLGTGDDAAHDFSAKVQCTNGQGIVVERPMYFNYDFKWNGGHDALGAKDLATLFYFAEGTCRPDFDAYLCIQNPGGSDANVTITYMKGDTNIETEKLVVGKNSRSTVVPRHTLGTGNDAAHDFSAKVECTNGKMILVERPMYFNFNGVWNDGHDAVGATGTGTVFDFAEGTCRPGFDPYYTILNIGTSSANVRLTYLKGDGTTNTQNISVGAGARGTAHPADVLGVGNDAAHDFSTTVECTNNQQILVERPMYFNYGGGGWNGGSNAMGYAFPAATTSVQAGTGMRKFVNTLPGLGEPNKNDLGQYIPVAIPDKATYPGNDYYEIEVGEYSEKLHEDLPATKLRGYRQTNTADPTVNKFHYLGPAIVAERNVPVRIKFTNSLPTGAGGDLFVPVDTTLMGAGAGPIPGEDFTQNRVSIHCHGQNSPWISDGTPYQWYAPAGEATSYKEGPSLQNVPDMWFLNGNVIPNTVGQVTPPVPGATNSPGEGSATYYYTNQQSARLLFYHDHAVGITRLNVMVGMAAPYLIQEQLEQNLVTDGTIPSDMIPLVIQDRTFVPDDAQLNATDPTWDKAKWGGKGNFWMPHVYNPNQNPAAPDGYNAFGRWHYGPWFWPPVTNITQGPVPNPYYDPVNAPWENIEMPGTPTPSMAMEAFLDTPLVNGTAYPEMTVQPKSYRFRILNAANDRFWNLQFYTAKSQATMWNPDGTLNDADAGEVKMVPAVATPGYPELWPTDGRDGGVPDPATSGPDWIQIGTEGGFLPTPTVLPNQPVTWNLNQTTFNFGVVQDHTMLLGPAERSDVVVDFSKYAGKTLIMYNDAPAAFPAIDPRYDYYTGNPDQTAAGGAPSTQPGYGPNTRTIMRIKVANTTPAPTFNMAKLNAAFTSTATTTSIFEATQDNIIVPEARYDSAYNGNFAVDPFARIDATEMTFNNITGNPLTIPLEPKAIQDEQSEAYDMMYGRMSAFLGLQLPLGTGVAQNFTLYPYASPPVDIHMDSISQGAEPAPGDGTQTWMITHNGVDTHTLHFHKYDVQIINRVSWDNQVIPIDDNELGWKETIRTNPLENIVVAMRPVAPSLPFDLPNSIRALDPSKPVGDPLPGTGPANAWFGPLGENLGPTIPNDLTNLGWEYVLHCHLLGHEEMDMMHGMPFVVRPLPPSNLNVTIPVTDPVLDWIDNSMNETEFVIEWALDPAGPWTFLDTVPGQAGTGNPMTYTDTSVWSGTRYYHVFARNTVGSAIPEFPRMLGDSAAIVSSPVVRP